MVAKRLRLAVCQGSRFANAKAFNRKVKYLVRRHGLAVEEARYLLQKSGHDRRQLNSAAARLKALSYLAPKSPRRPSRRNRQRPGSQDQMWLPVSMI
jgi:hypothetical protein